MRVRDDAGKLIEVRIVAAVEFRRPGSDVVIGRVSTDELHTVAAIAAGGLAGSFAFSGARLELLRRWMETAADGHPRSIAPTRLHSPRPLPPRNGSRPFEGGPRCA